MIVNILFSILGPALEGEQLEQFSAFGQWATLNERSGRLLFDAVAHPEAVTQAQQALAAIGREPVIIGAWHQDGTPVPDYPLNVSAWLDVAPDEVDASDPENPVHSRPTEFLEIHRWAGWEPKLNQ